MKGPTGCRYLADDRQRAYVQHGWNITGDTYVRDADGYFWYQARSDDMIISSGYNIAGPEVEEALLRHADVLECARGRAPGRGPRHARQRVRRAPRGRSARTTTVEGAAGLRQGWRSRRTSTRGGSTFVDALPRTNTGKLQRYRLREQSG